MNVVAKLHLYTDTVAGAKVNWQLNTEPKIVFRVPGVVHDQATWYIFDTKRAALDALVDKIVDFGIDHIELEIVT